MKAVTIALAVLSIACVITLSWVLATPHDADPRVASLETDLKAAKQKISDLQQELSRRPPPPAPGALANVKAPPPGNELASTLASNNHQPLLKGANLREMMANPAMRTMMEQQQAIQIDVGYSRLFEYLKLTDEERVNLKALLVERQKAATEIGMKTMDPNLTDEDRRKLAEDLRQEKLKYDASIKTFLNNTDDWGAFLNWEDTQPERSSLDAIGRNLFSASGEPLTQQQETQLINLMSNTRKNAPPPTGAGPQAMQLQLQQMEAHSKAVFNGAPSFLSGSSPPIRSPRALCLSYAPCVEGEADPRRTR